MSNITTNYTGRLIDLLVFDTPKPQGMTTVALGISNPAMVCTGIQKLAQIVVTLLLTESDSVWFDTAGTDFIRAARRGYLLTDGDIYSEFSLAASDIVSYLNKYQPADTPDDERIASLQLTDFNLEGDSLTLNIKITSEAGTSRLIFVPITAVIA